MMNDMQVLTGVRSYLLSKERDWKVHLTLPPKATYPLIIVQLEEICSLFPHQEYNKRKDIQAHVKFKLSIYSRLPGMEEIALLSYKTRHLLEGSTFRTQREIGHQKTMTTRFLACVTENNKLSAHNSECGRIMHHFYDCVIRG
jgi:hypothetical protein